MKLELRPTGLGRLMNSPIQPTHHVYVDGKRVGHLTKTHCGYDFRDARASSKPSPKWFRTKNGWPPRFIPDVRAVLKERFADGKLHKR